MPLYEYECDACAHRFEIIQQKFSDAAPDPCPNCGKTGTVRRLQSAPAFQFKGTGWYITDYARKDQKDQKGDQEKPTKTSKDSKESNESGSGSKDESGSKKEEKSTGSTDSSPSSTPASSSAPSSTPAKES